MKSPADGMKPSVILQMTGAVGQKGKKMPEYIVLSTVPMETIEELIRCKDCIYFNHEGRYRGESKWCSIYGREAKESDFCSWAERKEE